MIKAIYFKPTNLGYRLCMYCGLEISKPSHCYIVSDDQYKEISKYSGTVYPTKDAGCIDVLSKI